MKRIFLLLLMVGAVLMCNAQDSADTTAAPGADDYVVNADSLNTADSLDIVGANMPRSDSTFHGHVQPNLELYQQDTLTIRKFDSAQWKKIASNDFSEERDKEDTTTLRRKKPPVKKGAAAGPIMKIIGYVVIGGVIVFILFYLLKNMNWSAEKVDRSTKILDPEAPINNIDDFQVSGPLKDAIAAGNYRLAIRLYYLDLLKKLNTAGKIIWMKDKTNRDYLSELFAKSWHFDEVRKITLAYEQVWYGEHTLNADGFKILQNSFENMNRQLVSS